MEIEISKEKIEKLKEGFLGNLSYIFTELYKLLFKSKENVNDKNNIEINNIKRNPYYSSPKSKIEQIGIIDFNNKFHSYKKVNEHKFNSMSDFYHKKTNSDLKKHLSQKGYRDLSLQYIKFDK